MKSVSGKRLAKLARVNGSHHVFVKDDRSERLVIPIHGNESLKTGLQRALMKIIPITEAEL
jgi:predicted RNA binding protein YcfA (HicA-like mRNA interferase family)